MKGCEDLGPWTARPRAQTMKKSDEVEAMLHLHALGWGLKRIARELGCSKNTVRRYVEADGLMSYSRRAGGGKLDAQEEWLKERFFRHRGQVVATHPTLGGGHQLRILPEHRPGPIARNARVRYSTGGRSTAAVPFDVEIRDLGCYEAAYGISSSPLRICPCTRQNSRHEAVV